jgi:hypothetical protein
VPRKVMYWFGVGAVIKDRLFTDPAFCKHRTTGREDYYYPSAEASRLAQASACDIWDWAVSCYEVGVDWAQMFTSKVHSTGFIMLRWVWSVLGGVVGRSCCAAGLHACICVVLARGWRHCGSSCARSASARHADSSWLPRSWMCRCTRRHAGTAEIESRTDCC